MHKTILSYIFPLMFIYACNSVKSTQKAINTGNYDKAISLSLEHLSKNKLKDKNQPYVLMLQEAFLKVKQRDEARVDFLEREGKVENLESIYNLYLRLNNRQERIRPLLPLKIADKGTYAKFKMMDYSEAIISSKNELSEYVYEKALTQLNKSDLSKFDYRDIYKDLKYLNQINPNFKEVQSLMDEVLFKGTDFVLVSVENQTRQVIPQRLENDLLAMDTYGLNNQWTVYHAQRNSKVKYDYRLELNLRRIIISPEQVHEKELIREKQIKDGYKYLLNEQGNVVKDSLGNKIKVDKFKNIRCEVYKFTQFKSSRVEGVVNYIDINSKQLLKTFPIKSEFVFEHVYADYDGDKRALDGNFRTLIGLSQVRFPSNEEMIYDTGKDLKQKFKMIITRNRFPR